MYPRTTARFPTEGLHSLREGTTRRLADFELHDRLGTGAMGTVWRATHLATGTPVAVKVLRADRVGHPKARALFREEVRSIAALHHPGIVEVYDYGVEDGVPWLAMAWVDGATLAPGPLDWPLARQVLLDLLDALAHAHAHGVVHRDVKPDNLLVDAATGAVRLADFGIALSLDDAGERVGVAGTPAFMAPEQWVGTRRDLGPWTDLYAVGCVAWVLATGAPPFSGEDAAAFRQAHLAQEPELPALPVGWPDELRAWLGTLLAKAPEARFSCAADAARLLRDSGLPEPHRAAPVRQLEGAGLGLFGIRRTPLVGRKEVRRELWSALQAVTRDGRASVICLTGEPGVGRSRLADWLAIRAGETGAALALALDLDVGLERSVARWLRADGLSGFALQSWLSRRLAGLGVARDDLDIERVVDWLSGVALPREERLGLLSRLLQLLGAVRPIVVVLRGADAAELASDLRPLDAPVLVVMPEGLVEGARELRLGPLPEGDLRALVESTLGLRREVAARVAERAGGIPLFATQLVADWVSRGVLVPGSGGLEPAEGADLRLPDSLHELWTERLSTLSPPLLRALEVAAVLGREDDLATWAAACGHAGVTWDSDLVDTLARAGELTASEGRYRLAHALLVESLVRRLDEAGQLQAVHLACARAIPRLETPRRELQRATHLLAAGAFEEGIVSVHDAYFLLEGVGDTSGCVAARDLVARATRDRLPDSPKLRGHLAVVRVRGHALVGSLAAAEQAAREALAATTDPAQRERIAIQLGIVLMTRGDLGEATSLWEQALHSARARGDENHEGTALSQLTQARIRLGRPVAAELQRLKELKASHHQAFFHVLLAELALRQRRWDLAAHHAEEGVRLFEAGRSTSRALLGRGIRAEAVMRQGRHDEAARLLGELEDEARRKAMPPVILHQLSVAIGHNDVFRGEYAPAEVRLRSVLGKLEASGARSRVHGVHAALALCAWGRGDVEEASRSLERALEGAERGVERTATHMLQHAGETWAAAGAADLARRALDAIQPTLRRLGWA